MEEGEYTHWNHIRHLQNILFLKLLSVLACGMKRIFFSWKICLSTCYWNALEKKARRGREKSVWTQRQACNVAAPTRQHHKPTLTWPCRSVLSSIIAQVRQCTPSAKTGTIVNITYAQLQQTQLWRVRKGMRWVARISKDSWTLLMTSRLAPPLWRAKPWSSVI